jgi:hypothetical protein
MIDCTLFNDELELLIIRIRYLSDYVDGFIVIESDRTFSGKPKKLIARENLSELRKVSPKPIQLLCADFSMVQTGNPWEFEKQSRTQLISHVYEVFPDKRLLFCDIDEFPSVEQLQNIMKVEKIFDKSIFSIPTPTYYRYVNLAQLDEENLRSAKTFLASHPPQEDSLRSNNFIQIDGDPGAHLSYLGMSAEIMSSKFASFSHTELQGFEEVEMTILALADEYVVDHLGRFHGPSRGLLRKFTIERLPVTNKTLLDLRGGGLHESKLPIYPKRIYASALITYIRTNKGTSSKFYAHVINKIIIINPKTLSELGLYLVFFVFVRESFLRFLNPLLKKLSKLLALKKS